MGAAEGAQVGSPDGAAVGVSVGMDDGTDGTLVGSPDGILVGSSDGSPDGSPVGLPVGCPDGCLKRPLSVSTHMPWAFVVGVRHSTSYTVFRCRTSGIRDVGQLDSKEPTEVHYELIRVAVLYLLIGASTTLSLLCICICINRFACEVAPLK